MTSGVVQAGVMDQERALLPRPSTISQPYQDKDTAPSLPHRGTHVPGHPSNPSPPGHGPDPSSLDYAPDPSSLDCGPDYGPDYAPDHAPDYAPKPGSDLRPSDRIRKSRSPIPDTDPRILALQTPGSAAGAGDGNAPSRCSPGGRVDEDVGTSERDGARVCGG
ncbi:hypothetical protein BDZ85DRAFT_284344 [Elsinoe ampelina]|uniref:Uncharacterized protein n=1 Tax=Elsinoe ampelina TaxID=302913 RepID=A0A6A6G5A8_9PEZI|nr:hypothetical protein BDZ85DRAFT_284344 [Elsinoe ampelina]